MRFQLKIRDVINSYQLTGKLIQIATATALLLLHLAAVATMIAVV